MKPEPITVMILLMRVAAAAGAYAASKVLPVPLDALCSFVAHVMAIMAAVVVFGHTERVVGEYLLTWVACVRETLIGIALLIAAIVVIGLRPVTRKRQEPEPSKAPERPEPKTIVVETSA